MLWKDSFWSQINLVRDRIAGILARTYNEYRSFVTVIGTHNSKSIKCPVYRIHMEQDGIDITMRYNFYNWNVSIESDNPITCDFLGVASDGDYDYCFCEGMEKYKYDKMADSKHKFTVCIHDHYSLYVFFWVLRSHLGIKMENIIGFLDGRT